MDFLAKGLQPAAAQSFGIEDAKIHVCGLISIFCAAHVAAKNDFDFFRALRELCEAFALISENMFDCKAKPCVV